jgi:hypothetical protein
MKLHSDTIAYPRAYHLFRDITPFHDMSIFYLPICVSVPHPLVSCIHQPTSLFIPAVADTYTSFLGLFGSYSIRINTFLRGLWVTIRIRILRHV